MIEFLVSASTTVVGAVFLLAGISKIYAGQRWFFGLVQSYDLTNHFVSKTIAMVLPYLELLLGAFLILGIFRLASTVAALALLLVFTAAVALADIRGNKVDCGCFGRKAKQSSQERRTIYVRNFVMAVALSVYIARTTNVSSYTILLCTAIACISMAFLLMNRNAIQAQAASSSE